MVNQLQKRVNDLRVKDLLIANQVAREAKKHSDSGMIVRNLGHDVCVVVWHDSSLYNSVGAEIEECENIKAHPIHSKDTIRSQMGLMAGIVKRSDLASNEAVNCNYVDWKSRTNKRVVESSFAGEVHGGLHGLGYGHYVRAMLAEVYHGKEVIVDQSFSLESIMPLLLCTDCRSLFDCIKKEGSIPSDRLSAVTVAAFRDSVSAGNGRDYSKAELLWVPTRHQLADSFTKHGLSNACREIMSKGQAKFHGASAKAVKCEKVQRSTLIPSNVNSVHSSDL